MTPPKKITINYQPLKTAEGTPHTYTSDEALKAWAGEQAKKYNKDLHKLSLLIELLNFFNQE